MRTWNSKGAVMLCHGNAANTSASQEAGARCTSPIQSPAWGRGSSAPGAGVLMAQGGCSHCSWIGNRDHLGFCPLHVSSWHHAGQERVRQSVARALPCGSHFLDLCLVCVFISCIKACVLSLTSKQRMSYFKWRLALPCIQAEFVKGESLCCVSCYPNTTEEFS